MPSKQKNFYSNRSICISTVLLIAINLIILALGGLIYWTGYRSIRDKQVDGAPYLPEFNLTFDTIKNELFISCSLSVVNIFFGLLLALKKNVVLSVGYIIVAISCALYMLYTSSLFNEFDKYIND